MQKTTILDANCILRKILKDDISQCKKIDKIIDTEDLLILPEVVAEVVYILGKYYRMSKNIVSNNILMFLEDISYENNLLTNALKTFGKNKIDFIDCLLLHYSTQKNYKVFTLDTKLNKLIIKIANAKT
jgi:predicted nucleic-acid-binding protein